MRLSEVIHHGAALALSDQALACGSTQKGDRVVAELLVFELNPQQIIAHDEAFQVGVGYRQRSEVAARARLQDHPSLNLVSSEVAVPMAR